MQLAYLTTQLSALRGAFIGDHRHSDDGRRELDDRWHLPVAKSAHIRTYCLLREGG